MAPKVVTYDTLQKRCFEGIGLEITFLWLAKWMKIRNKDNKWTLKLKSKFQPPDSTHFDNYISFKNDVLRDLNKLQERPGLINFYKILCTGVSVKKLFNKFSVLKPKIGMPLLSSLCSYRKIFFYSF